MISLGNLRIIQLDQWNLTFEIYKETPKTHKMEWVKVGGYYRNLTQCLKALKEYIIANNIIENDLTISETIEMLDQLNDSYVKCELKG